MSELSSELERLCVAAGAGAGVGAASAGIRRNRSIIRLRSSLDIHGPRAMPPAVFEVLVFEPAVGAKPLLESVKSLVPEEPLVSRRACRREVRASARSFSQMVCRT